MRLTPEALVNRQLRIYWENDDAWFAGSVVKWDPATARHQVRILFSALTPAPSWRNWSLTGWHIYGEHDHSSRPLLLLLPPLEQSSRHSPNTVQLILPTACAPAAVGTAARRWCMLMARLTGCGWAWSACGC